MALAAPPAELVPKTMAGVFALQATDPVAIPVFGANRYLTAVEASKKFGFADAVVVATGEDFPDALGGAALAGALEAPILLTPPAAVPDYVIDEIDRLGASEIYVLGGTGAVSAAAFAQLDALIPGAPVRLGGATRYETAALVADEVIDLQDSAYDGGAFLATGVDFPDALAAGPIMYAQGMPLVLANAAGAFTLPAAVDDVYILGGTGAVPASAVTALGSKYADRLYGDDRYETAVEVAEFGIALGHGWNDLGVATGQSFPDALCAGPLIGEKGSVLLLTPTAVLNQATGDALVAAKDDVAQYYLFGGVGALSDDVRADIAEALAPEEPVGGSHDLPDNTCTSSGCHDTDLATIHLPSLSCAMCHGPNVTPTNDCATCHPSAEEAHAALHEPAVIPEGCSGTGCHAGTNLLPIHAGGTCETCHASMDPDVAAAIAAGDLSCTACHSEDIHDPLHESSVDAFCADCHDANLVVEHEAADYDCTACHQSTNEEIADAIAAGILACDACHDLGAHPHPPVTSSSAEPYTCTQADGCHGDNALVLHAGCASCHNASTTLTPATTCETCHDNPHPDLATVHVFSGFCAGSTCHGTDVTAMHTRDFRLSGEEPPGCAACHAPGVTPSINCSDCHADTTTPHDPAAAHAYLQDTIAAGSAGCVSCHGSDLMDVAPDEHVGCSCHAYGHGAGANSCESCHTDPMDPAAPHPYHVGAHATWESTAEGTGSAACVACHGSDLLAVGSVDLHVKDAHAGCVCHHYDDLIDTGFELINAKTTEATECVSCHSGAFAPHGFSTEPSVHHEDSWVSASGHNTETFPGVGAFTKYDGSEGVLVRDSSGATVTAQYPLPTQNVFWAADDEDAPAGAITGLGWDSVITCEDCHTDLENLEVSGPHGATVLASVGIDPNFPGDYETAALWAWVPPAPDGSFVATDKVDGVPAPMAASGMVQYVPGGSNLLAPSAYALRTPTSASTFVKGPAEVMDPDSVICAKCHDLHNPGTGHNANAAGAGDGYAHYHGHDYHDDPIQYPGLYQESDGTTYTAFMALTTGDTVLKAPAAGRGASGHCRNCHVAVPHGWQRPRLLVYETDRGPFNAGPSVDYAYSAAEGRYYNFATYGTAHPEGGQLKGISSIRSPEMVHEGEFNEYVNWSGADGMTCQACGHHYAEPTPGSLWE